MKRFLLVALAVLCVPWCLTLSSCSKEFEDDAQVLPTEAASTEAIGGFYKLVWDPVGETTTLDRLRTGVIYSFELSPTPTDRDLYFFVRIINAPIWAPLPEPYHVYAGNLGFLNIMWMLPGTYEIAVKESRNIMAPDLLSHRFEVYDTYIRIMGPVNPKVNDLYTFQAAYRKMSYTTNQTFDFNVNETIWDDATHGRSPIEGGTIKMQFPEPGRYEISVTTNHYSSLQHKVFGIYDLEFYYRPEFGIEREFIMNQYGSTESNTLHFYADTAHRIPMATPHRVRLRLTTRQGTVWTMSDGSRREEWQTPVVTDKLVPAGTMTVTLPANRTSILGNTTRITRTDVDYYPDHCGDRYNTYVFPVGPF